MTYSYVPESRSSSEPCAPSSRIVSPRASASCTIDAVSATNGRQAPAVVAVRLVDFVEVERLQAVQLLEDGVLVGQHHREALAEGVRVDQVDHADADAPDLVDERRPDAAERRADGRRAAQLLVGAVDEDVVGHDDVARSLT